MNLLSASILIVALFGALAAALTSIAAPSILRSLADVRPEVRTSWLLAVLAAPLLSGFTVLGLALGHCVAPRLLGLPDDCEGVLGRGCAICVYGQGRLHPAAWAAALACLLPVARAVWRSLLVVWRSHFARRSLALVSERSSDDVFLMPGPHAFVVGWPRPAVFVGADLSRALTREGVLAVTAHEREHLRRGDLTLRLLSRVLAATHLPWISPRLLEALDTATEQACDARASAAVDDPLIVAQALIDTARLHAAHGASPGCVAASLPARIQALCAPPLEHQGLRRPLAAIGGALAVGVLFDHEIHRAAELVVQLLAR